MALRLHGRVHVSVKFSVVLRKAAKITIPFKNDACGASGSPHAHGMGAPRPGPPRPPLAPLLISRCAHMHAGGSLLVSRWRCAYAGESLQMRMLQDASGLDLHLGVSCVLGAPAGSCSD